MSERLIGRKIIGVRLMKNDEKEALGFLPLHMVVVMDLDDGSVLVPCADYAPNGSGATAVLDQYGTHTGWVELDTPKVDLDKPIAPHEASL